MHFGTRFDIDVRKAQSPRRRAKCRFRAKVASSSVVAMEPSPLEKLKEPLVTRAESDKSIEAFERKRQEKVERQKNEIIDAATGGSEFEAVSLHSLTDNAKMLSLSLLFITCHLLTGVLYFHHIVGWPIDGKSLCRTSHLQLTRSQRLSCHLLVCCHPFAT